MRRLLTLLLACWLPLAAQAQKDVAVWTYHLTPPFVIDGDLRHGLSNDFVELLNRHAGNAGRFRFVLSYLPRKRLDLELQQGSAGVVLWVNPAFFEDAQASGQWSGALLHDEQSFVSLPARPVDYTGPESLHGRSLGGILGHRYAPIQKDIERGAIQREDVPTDEQNLRKLLAGRVEVVLVPRSTLGYLVRQLQLEGQLHESRTPLNRYARQLLMSRALDREAAALLDRVVAGLPDNADWRRLLARYALDGASCGTARAC